MHEETFSPEAFGDRFNLATLPLRRPADGYAVQMLNTDTILDRYTGIFLPVRTNALRGLFETFDAAYEAARNWTTRNRIAPDEHCLAIVPAAYDHTLQRHILIHGVLCTHP